MINFSRGLIMILAGGTLIYAQQTNLDWKISDVGPIRQLVTNMGHFGKGFTNHSGEFSLHHQMSCRYPASSGIEYGVWSPWVGAIRLRERLVTTGGPWNDDGIGISFGPIKHEFFPTAETWDTVWVVRRGEVVDIPYWPGYTGLSDLDLVCRFNDYTILTLPEHKPLYIDVIQITYAWTSLEFLVYQFWIIPKRDDLKDVYFGWFCNLQIGNPNNFSGWLAPYDFTSYNPDLNLAIGEDVAATNNDSPTGPIGFRLFPDEPADSVEFSYFEGNYVTLGSLPAGDYGLYTTIMNRPGIYTDPIQSNKEAHFYNGIGPFQLPLGDTLHVTVAQILGKGFEGMYENYDRFLVIKNQDYRMPAPPPMPPVRTTIANHQTTLTWDVRPGDVNPETYTDPYRQDGETEPFEGYRVYKSLISPVGPWTMLAEYDRLDDAIGRNFGLAYSYTDMGLLNNLEYYYTVTSFSKPDTVLNYPSLESSPNANAKVVIPGTAAPATVGKVAVVPNPYRGDEKYYTYKPAWEIPSAGNVWLEEDRRIQFINLPNPCEIKIYTVAGQYVITLQHDDPSRGYEDWNLTSHVGQAIASGLYLFSVKDLDNGEVQIGKFVIIK